MVLLQYLVRITFRSSAQADSTCRKKAFSQLSVQFADKIVTFVKFPQSFDVIWKLLFAWRGVSCRLPFARHAPILVQTCLPGNRSQHLQVEKNRSCVFTQPFF